MIVGCWHNQSRWILCWKYKKESKITNDKQSKGKQPGIQCNT